MNAMILTAVAAVLASPSPALADQTIVDARITGLASPATAFARASDGEAVVFEIDRAHAHACSAGQFRTAVTVPGPDASDVLHRNRDFAKSAQLAHKLGRKVTLYLDGCIGGVARVVGIEML